MPASTTSIVPSDLHQSFLFFFANWFSFLELLIWARFKLFGVLAAYVFSFRMTGKKTKTKSPTYVSNPEEIFRCLGATFDQVVLFLFGIVRLFSMIQKHPLKSAQLHWVFLTMFSLGLPEVKGEPAADASSQPPRKQRAKPSASAPVEPKVEASLTSQT